MGNEMTCPKCRSNNCECTDRPTHMHRCLDCGYNGTSGSADETVVLRAEVARLTEANTALAAEVLAFLEGRAREYGKPPSPEHPHSLPLTFIIDAQSFESAALREVNGRLIEALRELYVLDNFHWLKERRDRIAALLAGAASPVQESPKP